MTQNLHGQGVAVTAYFNPMVCTNYQPVYDQFLAADALTKNADGSTLVFPYNTASHFLVSQIDFSAAAGRDLFEGLLGEAVDDGYDGWMEDFGEYMPDDALSADGTPGTQMHNRYVEEYHAAAREFEETCAAPADPLQPVRLDRRDQGVADRVGRRPDHQLGLRRPGVLGP